MFNSKDEYQQYRSKDEYQQYRMFKPMPQSRRPIERRGRPSDIGKHTHYGPEHMSPGVVKVDRDGEPIKPQLACWHETQVRPWTKKAKTRAANKRARAARKLNRGAA